MKVCIIEDDPNVLMRANHAALANGCTIYAQPELFPDQYVSIVVK
jgi:hypothetical protein